MITTYEIGAVFRVVDEATANLRRIADQLEIVDRISTSVRTKLMEISDVRFTALSRSVGALERNFTGLGSAADRAAIQIGTGLASITGGLASATAQAGMLLGQMRAIAAAGGGMGAGGAGAAAAGAAAGGAGRGRGGGGGRHGVHTHVGGGIPVAGGHAGFSMGSGGTGGIIAGGIATWGVIEAMKASMEPLHQQVLYRQLGASEGETQAAVARAWEISRSVPGTRTGGNLALIADARSIVGQKEALEMAPGLARTEQVLNNLSDKGGKKGSMLDLLRSGELTGAFTDENRHVDIDKFNRFLDFSIKTAEATHGKVMPSDLLALAKQGAPTLGSLNEEGWQSMAIMTQAMSGNRAGTAMTALQRQFLGGRMTQGTLSALEQMGIADAKDFTVERGGHVVPKPGAMKELVGKFQSDPFSAFTDVIIPKLREHGVSTFEQFQPWIYKLFGTQTSQRAAFELFRGGEQFTGERKRLGEAMGVDKASGAMGKDPEQSMRTFTAAFENLLAALGGPLMEAVIPKMNALANVFNMMGGWFSKHETATTVAGTTAAGGGVGALLGGVGGFIFGGPGGALAGAMAGGRIGAGLGLGWGAYEVGQKGANDLAGMPLPPASAGVYIPPKADAAGNIGISGTGMAKLADTVNIRVESPTANPEAHAEAVAGALSRLLSKSSTHNLDEGAGNLQSPWTGGQ